MKKLISIFLCLLLAAGLLPMAALAGYVYAVNVEVAVPMAGQTPAEVAPAVNSDVTSVYAYDWYDNGEKMSSWYDRFEKGKTYTMAVAVSSPGDFYKDARTYINGTQVPWTKLADHLIRFSLDFTVTEEQLNDLTVTLPQAMPGSKMSKVAEEGVVEGTEGAVIQAIFWYLNGEEIAPKSLFKTDMTYEAGIRLYAREGYRFAVPLRVTCNGQTFDNVAGDGETAYFKIQYSTDAKGQTAGSVDAFVKEPKAGEKPVPYDSISGGGGFGMINWSDTAPYEFYRNATEWFDLTAQIPQSYEDPFLEGHAYRVTIHCILYDGFEWPDPSVHRINGKAPTGIEQQGDKLALSYDFPPIDSTASLKHVDAVSFEVDAPAIGKKPTKVWQKSAEYPYNVFQWNDVLKQNGTRWFERDGNGNRVKELGENDVFEANKQYELEAMIFCQNGYCFTDEAVSNAKINDQPVATVRSDDKTEMTLTMIFPALKSSAKTIETVEIGVTAPVGGAHPVYAFTTGSPLLTPYPMIKELEDLGVENSILWGDENSKLPPGGTFTAGTDYTVMIFIQVDPDYYVPANAAVTVNGAAPKDWDFNADAHALSIRTMLTAKAAKTPVALTVTAPPAKTAYKVGEAFDPAGMVVTATYSDQTTAEVTGYAVTPQTLGKDDKAVTISYTENNATVTAAQAVTVKAPEKTLAGIAITAPPAKTAYTAGQSFDPAGMVVTATYSDQSTAAVTGWTVTPTALTVNDTYVTISYTEGNVTKTATTPVTVKAPKTLSSIAVTVAPTKTTYTAGQSFDPAGMVVTASYTDYTSSPVTGYTVTPTALTVNDTYVTISYTEGNVTKTATTPVTVKAPKTLSGITITKAPNKTEYTAGQAFDPAGMVVTATYTDGTTDTVAGYSVTPKLLALGATSVTVSYSEGDVTKTATQAVTVKKNEKPNPFTDVFETDYYYDAVLWAYYAEPQVTNGMSATEFGPKNTVTRGQAVTFLWRAMGRPEPKSAANPFVDVASNEYYYKAVLWAVEKGITKGTDETHFTPGQTCSTAHIITFLYRTLGVGADGWGEESAAWAKNAGLLAGLNSAVAPGVDCPRCDVVLFLHRAVGK